MRIICLLSIVGLSIIGTGCTTSSPDLTKDELLTKVKATVDPNNILKEAKTKVLVCQVEHEDKTETAKLFIKVKYPDKLKRMLVVPEKGIFIEAYNGKVGWTYSTKEGITEMTGDALDELKLQTAMAVNMGNLKSVFKTFDYKGDAEISGKRCYKIIGQPKDIYKSQPVIFYINKKTFLPQAKEEFFDGPKRNFPVVTVWNNYKKDQGVMIPMNRVVDLNGTLLDITVLSVEWDTYIDDSEFEPPVKLQ